MAESNTKIESAPAVIDIEALLQPISADSPAGESLRYAGTYDEINEARREDDALLIGDTSALKRADHKKVIAIASEALQNRSKDLQIAAWLTNSLIREHGWVGLRDGIQLMAAIQDNFWDALHPEIDEGDMEGRANAVEWVSNEGAFSIKWAPITSPGLGFSGFEDSQKFDIPESFEGLSTDEREKFEGLKAQAERENRVTGDAWRRAIIGSNRAFCEQTSNTIAESFEALKTLNDVIDRRYDSNQAPSLKTMHDQLDVINREAAKILDQKRTEEPDAPNVAEFDTPTNEDSGSGSVNRANTKTQTAKGAIQGRADALRRLADLAVYFKKTEPHSPVSYLIDRAVKWGNMPLDSWLSDVVKDESILNQIRQTLGFNTEGGAMSDPSPAPSYSEPDVSFSAPKEEEVSYGGGPEDEYTY